MSIFSAIHSILLYSTANYARELFKISNHIGKHSLHFLFSMQYKY